LNLTAEATLHRRH